MLNGVLTTPRKCRENRSRRNIEGLSLPRYVIRIFSSQLSRGLILLNDAISSGNEQVVLFAAESVRDITGVGKEKKRKRERKRERDSSGTNENSTRCNSRWIYRSGHRLFSSRIFPVARFVVELQNYREKDRCTARSDRGVVKNSRKKRTNAERKREKADRDRG